MFLIVSDKVARWHRLCLTFMPSERWLSRVHRMEGVGTLLLHKFDQSRATRNTQEVQLYKGQFADDVVLLACSRQGSSLQQDRTCVRARVCV